MPATLGIIIGAFVNLISTVFMRKKTDYIERNKRFIVKVKSREIHVGLYSQVHERHHAGHHRPGDAARHGDAAVFISPHGGTYPV